MTENVNVFSRPENDLGSGNYDCSEARVRESEQRFRTTFENAAVGIAHVAPDGRWLLVNKRYCEIVGYTAEELAEKTFQDITHPEDIAVDLAQRHRVLSGAISNFSMEKRYIRKNGSPIWVNLTVGSARTANGPVDYFISVVEDITRRKEAEDERRRVEAKLRESEADLQLAQEAANLGRWSWDLRTQDLTWTDRCKAFFGVPLDAPMSYAGFLSALHPGDRSMARCPRRSARAKTMTSRCEQFGPTAPCIGSRQRAEFISMAANRAAWWASLSISQPGNRPKSRCPTLSGK